MAKRFTESSKWSDKWYRCLSPAHKLAWLYLLDYCDAAGVIELDEELASFQIGVDVDWDGFMEATSDRIERLPSGKIWITGFIKFQYGELSEGCRPHQKVIQLLEGYGLWERVSKGYPKGMYTLEDKDKDKEEDQDSGIKKKTSARFRPPQLDEVRAYCEARKNSVDPEQFVDHYTANGWKQANGNPIKDWHAAVRTWEKNTIRSRAGPRQSTFAEQRTKNTARAIEDFAGE